MTVTISFPSGRWVKSAACREVPVSVFFPGEGYRGKYEEAAPICASCSVQLECLDWALDHEYHGYWGGTSERQRVRIRRDREFLKALVQARPAV
jgi:hypothetical protein